MIEAINYSLESAIADINIMMVTQRRLLNNDGINTTSKMGEVVLNSMNHTYRLSLEDGDDGIISRIWKGILKMLSVIGGTFSKFFKYMLGGFNNESITDKIDSAANISHPNKTADRKLDLSVKLNVKLKPIGSTTLFSRALISNYQSLLYDISDLLNDICTNAILDSMQLMKDIRHAMKGDFVISDNAKEGLDNLLNIPTGEIEKVFMLGLAAGFDGPKSSMSYLGVDGIAEGKIVKVEKYEDLENINLPDEKSIAALIDVISSIMDNKDPIELALNNLDKVIKLDLKSRAVQAKKILELNKLIANTKTSDNNLDDINKHMMILSERTRLLSKVFFSIERVSIDASNIYNDIKNLAPKVYEEAIKEYTKQGFMLSKDMKIVPYEEGIKPFMFRDM